MIQVFNYQDSPIQFEEMNGQVMANATLMCQAFNKRAHDWLKTSQTQRYIEAISITKKIVPADLVVVRNGGAETGTWVHEKLILSLARWLDVEFELWCDEKIAELLRTGKAFIKVLTPAEQLYESAKALVDHEKKLNALKQRTDVMEDKLNSIMEVRRNTEMELRALPVSVDALPEMGLRDKVRLLVNRYCNACNVAQQTVWDHVYQTLYYTYHVAIKQYTKESKQESWLDVAERKGHMDKIYIIVSNMLKRKGLSNI